MLSHILANWKTSAAGVLICIITVAGVLSQQGITLGSAGTGTIVALAAAIATALLGLLARDPSPASSSEKPVDTTRRLGAVMLIAILLMSSLPVIGMTGCNVTPAQLQADGQSVATALSNLASAIQATDPSTAANLQTAAAAVEAAASSSTSGPAWEQALNAAVAGAEVVLAAIPITAPYAALIAIAVPAIEFILTNTVGLATAHAMSVADAGNLAAYSRMGHAIVKHRFGRSVEGDFKAAWNLEAKRSGFVSVAIK